MYNCSNYIKANTRLTVWQLKGTTKKRPERCGSDGCFKKIYLSIVHRAVWQSNKVCIFLQKGPLVHVL